MPVRRITAARGWLVDQLEDAGGGLSAHRPMIL
jgi:hypothetical protein